MKSLLRVCFLFNLSIIFVACSSQKGTQLAVENTYDPNPGTPEQIGNAVTAPLNDLNIVRTAIPKVLRDAKSLRTP